MTDETFSMTPTTLDEAKEYAKLIANSSMIPADYQGKPGNVLVAMQMGHELGLKPLAALQNIAVINGRPSVWGDALIGLVRSRSECQSVHEHVEYDNNGEPLYAECTVKRHGQEAETRRFSKRDAERAGLWNKQGPWRQYPQRMLQMRARSWALRDVFGDILKGLNVAEESYDIPQERYMGQAHTEDDPVAALNEQFAAEPDEPASLPEDAGPDPMPAFDEQPQEAQPVTVDAEPESENSQSSQSEPEDIYAHEEETPQENPIDNYMARMDAAESIQELKAIGQELVNLPDAQKDVLRPHYEHRLQAMKDNGNQKPEGAPASSAQIVTWAANAADADELAEVEDMKRHFEGGEKQSITKAVNKRKEELGIG